MKRLSLIRGKWLWLAVLITCSVYQTRAQSSFTNVPIDNLNGVDFSSAVWADYDNDGRLDFLLTGYNSSSFVSELWRNTGSGFSKVPVAGLPGVAYGNVAWGDFDNDGRLDFLLTGTPDGSARVSQVWRNTGAGFTNVPIAGLPGAQLSSVAWGDYDNDGRLDFLLTGSVSTGRVCQLWRNTGTGFTNVPIAGLPGVVSGSVAWADYDNDGWLDFLLTGSANTGRVSQLWRNTGNGFTNMPVPGLPAVQAGAAVWGDYDGDGRLDFLITGTTNGSAIGAISQLWRNTGAGFTNVPVTGLPGVYYSTAAWGDYDNDGRLDFLIIGNTDGTLSGVIAQLWRNTGSGFTSVPISGLQGAQAGSVAWGDYDNDGRLDFLLTACTPQTFVSQVWRNAGGGATNAAPAPPTGLAATVSNGLVRLSWKVSSDDHTPASGLSYNFRVGTASGGVDIVSPEAGSGGFRRLPALGNCQLRTNALLALPQGAYYWSVQAIDGAFAGSAFSAEQIVTVGNVVSPPRLVNLQKLGTGAFRFAFTNLPGSNFTAFATTNLSLPFSNWTTLGAIPEISGGQYQFTDTQATNSRQRFYRVRSP